MIVEKKNYTWSDRAIILCFNQCHQRGGVVGFDVCDSEEAGEKRQCLAPHLRLLDHSTQFFGHTWITTYATRELMLNEKRNDVHLCLCNSNEQYLPATAKDIGEYEQVAGCVPIGSCCS